MSEELKPCPFCAANPKIKKISVGMFSQAAKLGMGPRWDVSCTGNSQCVRVIESTKEEAIAAWNTRAPQWRPIESAPTDGTRVLLCCMTTSISTPQKIGFIAVSGYDEGGWPEFNRHHWPATHWQPLPAPPEVES